MEGMEGQSGSGEERRLLASSGWFLSTEKISLTWGRSEG